MEPTPHVPSEPARTRATTAEVLRRRAVAKALVFAIGSVGAAQHRVSLLLSRREFLAMVGRPDPALEEEVTTARNEVEEARRQFEADVGLLPERFRDDSRVLRLRNSLERLQARLE
jgi:hypothetical protein